MVSGSIFRPPPEETRYFDTPEEIEEYTNYLLKQEILERIGEIIKQLSVCYEFSLEPDINKFLVKAFSAALEASLQIKIIKSKCNYDGAYER